MDIILGKNGRLYLNESGTPLEGRLPNDPAVFLANPKPGDSIVYDGEKWVPGTVGGAESLSDLSDVVVSGVAEGYTLSYDAGTQKWRASEPMRVYELTEETVDDDTFLSLGGEYALDSGLFTRNLCWLVIDGTYYGIAQIDLPEDGDQAVHFQNGDIYTQDAETGYWVKNAAT